MSVLQGVAVSAVVESDETMSHFIARHGKHGVMAGHIREDLESFGDWREWSAATMAAYIVCLVGNMNSKVTE